MEVIRAAGLCSCHHWGVRGTLSCIFCPLGFRTDSDRRLWAIAARDSSRDRRKWSNAYWIDVYSLERFGWVMIRHTLLVTLFCFQSPQWGLQSKLRLICGDRVKFDIRKLSFFYSQFYFVSKIYMCQNRYQDAHQQPESISSEENIFALDGLLTRASSYSFGLMAGSDY